MASFFSSERHVSPAPMVDRTPQTSLNSLARQVLSAVDLWLTLERWLTHRKGQQDWNDVLGKERKLKWTRDRALSWDELVIDNYSSWGFDLKWNAPDPTLMSAPSLDRIGR